MKININILFAVLMISILVLPAKSKAQSCGFGCLGLAGFQVGYTYHSYEATNFNEFLTIQFTQSGVRIPKYEAAQGLRLGANFFRAQFENFFFSAKGYYQFLNEENEILWKSGITENKNLYRMKLNHFGLGIDFGIPVFHFMDWKIVEGGMNFYNAEIELETYENNTKKEDIEFENKKTDVGYYIASGLVFHIVKDYISLEGSAVYNFFRIDELSTNDNSGVSNGNAVIDKGGFAAAVQLNLGVPL